MTIGVWVGYVGVWLVSGKDVDSRSFGYAQDRFRGNDGEGRE